MLEREIASHLETKAKIQKLSACAPMVVGVALRSTDRAIRRRREGFAFGEKTREGVWVYIVKLKNNRYLEK